jgi:cytoskeletal protein CcmA (bactofilin family)
MRRATVFSTVLSDINGVAFSGQSANPESGDSMWKHKPKRTDKSLESLDRETTYIGESIVIKGDLSGSESIYVAGSVTGNVQVREGSLTVEPEGRIHGDLEARKIVVHGRVEGNLFGTKTVEIKRSAVLIGDIHTSDLAIEEGASLKGSAQMQKKFPAYELRKAG